MQSSLEGPTSSESGSYGRNWIAAGGGILACVAIIVPLYWDGGIKSALNLWVHSGAYNHCFLIIPIFAYMVWSNRANAKGLAPKPTAWGSLVIALFALLWFIGYFAGIAEAAQFAIVGVIEGVCLTMLGVRVYMRFFIPFLYLWLLVPTGEFLLLPLQNLGAHASADLLNLSGIPAFRDGFEIEVSNGRYMVAPGCAGLNFVLAALALSLAFGELEYTNNLRKFLFVAVCLALAVVGNVARIYLIIAIAHLTDNVGDIVDDHLLYGWGFFALLLFGVMAFGHRFRQPPNDSELPTPTFVGAAGIWRGAALATVAAAIVPVAAWAGWRQPPALLDMAPPRLSCGGYSSSPVEKQWDEVKERVDALAEIDCVTDGRIVRFGVAVLRRPLREGKAVGLEKSLNKGDEWSTYSVRTANATIQGAPVSVRSEMLVRGEQRRLVWSLFWIDGAWRKPGIDTILADLLGDLAGARKADIVIIETDVMTDASAAEATLGRFLTQLPLDDIVAAIDRQ